MLPLRVLPSPTRTLVLLFVAGLLLTGSLDPFAGGTGDAQVSLPLTADEEKEPHVTFQCYRATVESNAVAAVTLHFPDGLEQQLVLSPGTHTVQGTGINRGKPLTSLTIATEVSVDRYDNPRYHGCDQGENTMTMTTTTSTTTATSTPTTATSTTTTNTNTTTPTTTTPPPTTTAMTATTTTETSTRTTTTATTEITPPTTTTRTPTTTTTASRLMPNSASTTRTPPSAVSDSETTHQTTSSDGTDTTETTSATETETERESPRETAVPNGSNANSGGDDIDPPLRDGGTPKNEWTAGDTVALLLVCLGGLLMVGPRVLVMSSGVVSRVNALQER